MVKNPKVYKDCERIFFTKLNKNVLRAMVTAAINNKPTT